GPAGPQRPRAAGTRGRDVPVRRHPALARRPAPADLHRRGRRLVRAAPGRCLQLLPDSTGPGAAPGLVRSSGSTAVGARLRPTPGGPATVDLAPVRGPTGQRLVRHRGAARGLIRPVDRLAEAPAHRDGPGTVWPGTIGLGRL